MTIMWWHKQGSTSSTNPFGYCWGGPSSNFRCFVAGASGSGMLFRGSPLGDFNVNIDIQTGKANVWQHFALVIDDKNGVARWYVDGEQANSVTFLKNTWLVANTDFEVGKHQANVQTYSQYYSFDDFRFYRKALTRVQVIAGMAEENASAGTFGTSCGPGTSPPTITSTGGRPTSGNANFALNLSGATASRPMVLALGLGAHFNGALPIPLTTILGTGCNLESGFDLLIAIGTTSSTGTSKFPLAVPPGLPGGFHAYGQFLFLGPTNTNGGVTQVMDINVH